MHNIVFRLLLDGEHSSRWVFTKPDGRKINIHSIEAKFRRQLTRLGIAEANLHTWRHTFAANFIRETRDMRAVLLILGHKSIKTTQIYAHLSNKHLSELVNQLPGPKMGTILGTPIILPGHGIT